MGIRRISSPSRSFRANSWPFDRSIDVRITRVRRKIEVDAAHPQVIKTVRGSGYMFISED